MSSSQQDAGDNRSIPGTDRVDELAEYLVELREQTGLTLNNQQDYKKIRQLVLCNATLMQQTTLQRVGVNQTTLMQWYNQRLKGQEASVLLQGRSVSPGTGSSRQEDSVLQVSLGPLAHCAHHPHYHRGSTGLVLPGLQGLVLESRVQQQYIICLSILNRNFSADLSSHTTPCIQEGGQGGAEH
ncbi:hypothetical protein D4764_0258640, partial [Takifugu flavidus]